MPGFMKREKDHKCIMSVSPKPNLIIIDRRSFRRRWRKILFLHENLLVLDLIFFLLWRDFFLLCYTFLFNPPFFSLDFPLFSFIQWKNVITSFASFMKKKSISETVDGTETLGDLSYFFSSFICFCFVNDLIIETLLLLISFLDLPSFCENEWVICLTRCVSVILTCIF
jgi:hypothetical protein